MGKPSTEDLLRDQPWEKIAAQLTAYAYRRTRRRSWALAEELAQEAIARAYERKDGWDPEKGPLLKYLATIVIGLALQEWRRKRNAFEVAMDDDEAERVASDEDATDERLHRGRLAEHFRERLADAVRKNEVATMVVTLMTEEIATPRDQAAATGLPIAAIRDARRVVFYHADRISKELGVELDSEEEEVAQ